MDIYELETYRLSDAVKFNDRLNPRIWGRDQRLLPQVRERLLAMADDFREFLGLGDLAVQDITISGSNAGYTYTDHSDIDLHLVVAMPERMSNDVYRELFDAKKYQYNDQHDFRIGPAQVELYVQDADQPHHSQGIYSVMRDEWNQVPRRRRVDIDDMSVRSKYLDLGHRIDAAIASGDAQRMQRLAQRIGDMRRSGLADTGEFGPENLAFKILRNNGTLELLKQARLRAKSQELSLDERRKSKYDPPEYRAKYPKRNQAQRDYPGMFPRDRFKGRKVDHGHHKRGRVGRFTGKKAPGGPYDGYYNRAFKWFGRGMDDYDKAFEDQSSTAPPQDLRDVIPPFAAKCAEFLGIEKMPRVVLKRDPEWTRRNGTFGQYDPDTHTLTLSIASRHALDVLRTMAHEMTHARQNELSQMPASAGETGSPWEDEANAMAGRFMRHVADNHPELFQGIELGEDFDPNGPPPGPESPPTMPAGTVRVDVSDVYDWYKLGQHISNMKGLGKHDFGKGPPSTVLSFGDENTEHKYIQDLAKSGLDVTDIDPADPKQPPGMKKIKTDPTYNVNEASGYIPVNDREARDPRYSMAITQDIRPGETQRQAAKMGWKTDRAGRPPLLMPRVSAKKTPETNMKVKELLKESKLGGFEVKPLTIGDKLDELKLDAPQRRMSRDELQAYADRIKTGTKTKQDRFAPIVHGSNIKGIVKDDGTTEWDLDDLAQQIMTRPRQLLGTNAKMAKSKAEGAITYDLTLPALSGIVVDEDNGDFVEITTCPKAGECQLFCYARKGGYVMFPAASMSAAQALNFLVNDPQGYMDMVDREVTAIKTKTGKAGVKLEVRWHDAGDFFSKEYLDLAFDVARKHPDVDFYAYTKVADVATADKPKNFIINFSSGAKRSEEKKIELYRQGGNVPKQAITVAKPLFRDLFVTDAKGKYVKDEKGRTQVKDAAAWDRFRNNLAQTYKVDADSIITYDQLMDIPRGDQPRWNVVIFPSGHGDRAANRRDVINSFLLFH